MLFKSRISLQLLWVSQETKLFKSLNSNSPHSQIERILSDESAPEKGEEHLADLTAGERRPGAEARDAFLAKGVNQDSLNLIGRN